MERCRALLAAGLVMHLAAACGGITTTTPVSSEAAPNGADAGGGSAGPTTTPDPGLASPDAGAPGTGAGSPNSPSSNPSDPSSPASPADAAAVPGVPTTSIDAGVAVADAGLAVDAASSGSARDAQAGAAPEAAASDGDAVKMSAAVYDEGTIVDFFLTFAPGDWDKLLTLTGPASTRWIPCGFSGLGSPVLAAACRRKGNVGAWPIEKKPQIIVRFNLMNPDGRFRGLRRLNLEFFDGSTAPIRDRIAMWAMREGGVDAPRVNHARVFKDGVLVGLYQNIEVEDQEFLESRFGADSQGNLWEGGRELETNEAINDQSRLRALNNLVEGEPLVGDHSAFFVQLATMIDVSQFLREMAGETALIANDNFSNGSTNFNFYEHPKRGFLVLPWDLDTILTHGPANADLYDFRGASDAPSRLRLLINQNPVWKKQFEDELIRFRDDVLPRLPAKVDAVCAQIGPAFQEDPVHWPNTEETLADCTRVKNAAIQRIAAIKTILGR
jgi:hypothetical protein